MKYEASGKSSQPRGPEILRALYTGEESVGHKSFTEAQKKELGALLARSGYAVEYNFPIYAETVMDIIDYVNESLHSEKKSELASRILNAFAEAQERMGDQEYDVAA